MNSVAFKGVETQLQPVEAEKAEKPEVQAQPAAEEQKGAEALANYNAAMIQKPEVQQEIKPEEEQVETAKPEETK